MLARLRFHLLPLAVFLLLALFGMRPVSTAMTELAPGARDLWLQIWNQWWMKTALLQGSNPFFTDYVFYPDGVALYFHALTPFNSLLSVPLQLLFGQPVAINLVFLAAFWLAGYGAFLLAHYLTGRIGPSLLAGAIYAFSPYQFFHIRQLEHMSIQWFPFLVLFLMRMMDRRPAVPDAGRGRYAVVAGLFFAINFYTNVYFGLFSIPLLALILLFDLLENRGERAALAACCRRWILFATVGALLVGPYLGKMIAFSFTPGRFRVPLHVNIHQSLDLLSFVTPSFLNPLVAGWFPTMFLYERFTGWEPVGFLGFSVLALAVLGALRGAGRRRALLAAAALLFLVLSLGPVLHVAGRVHFFGGRVLLLPQAVLQVLPVVSAARVPARYLAVAMLPIALLAAMGFARLTLGASSPRRRLIGAILVALVAVEYWNGPIEATSLVDPPWHAGVIRADPEDVVVVDLPLRIARDPAEWWRSIDPDTRGWYQTLHGKRAIYGPISHTALTRRHYLALLESPLLGPLVSWSDTAPILPRAAARAELQRLRLRYFVLHRSLYDRMSPGDLARDLGILREAWGAREIRRESDVILLRLD